MDPISLDNIIIAEDENGDGFDLSLVEPPDEFKSDDIFNDGGDGLGKVQAESISSYQGTGTVDKVHTPEIKTSHDHDGFGNVIIDTVKQGSSNISKSEEIGIVDLNLSDSEILNGSSIVMENSPKDKDLNKADGIGTSASISDQNEIGNDDIQITLEDGGHNQIGHVDLFGAVTDKTSENNDKKTIPVDLFAPINDQFMDNNDNDEQVNTNDLRVEKREENVFIGEIQAPKLAEPDLIESTRKKIQPGEDLVRMNSEPEDKMEADLDDDTSFPDMAIHRLRKDSSSGSEFDFELPQVKKKVQDAGPKNGTVIQSSNPDSIQDNKTPTVLQSASVLQSEQTTVTIETSKPTTTKGGNFESITNATKKIIQYEPSENPIQDRSANGATNEWDNVKTIEAGFVKEGETVKPTLPESSPVLSYFEMQDQLIKTDYSSVKSQIHTTVDRRGFSALKHFIFGPPKMHRNLLPNREKVFCIAAAHFENSDMMHTRSLQTIYKCLTGSRFDCSRFGSHWEEIGFQGNDPATDLRGAGMFGVMNLIYLLRDSKCHVMAKDIYKLSLHPTQNFPFCVMGINMSRITLQCLREDCLNKECNRRQDVFGVVNDFYAGIYLQMYQLWKSKGKTISDSGFVIKHIETEAKKNPHHVFKNLEDYLRTKKSMGGVNLENIDLGGDNFMSVCDTEAGQYKTIST